MTNHNKLLRRLDSCVGVKTGFTGKAGYCFVGAVERDDRLLISVVLASGWPPHKTYKWNDTKLLMNYGLEAFRNMPLVENMESLPELPALPVEDGQKKTVSLCYAEAVRKELSDYKLLRTGEEEISYQTEFRQNRLQAPVEQGVTVGELIITIDGECIKKIPVQTAEAVVPVDYRFYFGNAVELFFSGEVISRLLQLLP